LWLDEDSSTMDFVYDNLFVGMWVAWGLYWLISAAAVKSSVRRESALSRWMHYGPLIIGGWLLASTNHFWAPLSARFMVRTELTFWIAAAVTAAGLLFSVWARVHLGRNWSGEVTIKADHELVTSGPYRLARHPIYTGLLLAFVGNALVVAEWRGVLAVAIVFAALWRKLKLEERWMREQFGESYANYARHTAALVPFLL
jgi:protein-S-isoprenylcysteine O-methyltransferase Ste14